LLSSLVLSAVLAAAPINLADHPDWIVRAVALPGPVDVERGARALLRCRVTDTGELTDCWMVTEALRRIPRIEAAALKAAREVRVRTRLSDGRSLVGAEVLLPVDGL
jgi:hypothetical protein